MLSLPNRQQLTNKTTLLTEKLCCHVIFSLTMTTEYWCIHNSKQCCPWMQYILCHATCI